MKQTLLRFSLPTGVRMYPNDLREALARTNRLPASFFGYDLETGFPIRQPSRKEGVAPTAAQKSNRMAIPGIRVVGGASWVGILATGAESQDLLNAAIAPAIEAVNGHCKAAVPVRIENPIFYIESQEFPSAYWVREMVIKKGAGREVSDDERMAVVKRRIETSIAAQAEAHGLDCPPEPLLDVRVAELIRPRGLRIVTTSGPTDQYACLLDVRFYASAKLCGFWFAGNLTARGYGRISFGDFGNFQPEVRT